MLHRLSNFFLKCISVNLEKLNRKSAFSTFENVLENDFRKFKSWVDKMWQPKNDDLFKTYITLDSDIILIKQNMFIISLNSLIEQHFENIIKTFFSNHLENKTFFSNHFYLKKDDFIKSENNKIDNIIKSNHNATYQGGFLLMLEKILDNKNDYTILKEKIEEKIKEKIKEKINKNNIDLNRFKDTLKEIADNRNSLGHNFDKCFSVNNIDYKNIYYPYIEWIKEILVIIYLSLEDTINQ